MAALKAQLATMDPAALHTARFQTNQTQGFREALRASGAFRVESVKAASAVESYTTALQKQDVTFKNWRKSAGLRNQVLREQYRIQQMMVMGWQEDAKGRMTGDMVIPRDAPARLGSFKKSLADVRSGAASFGQVLGENRMRIGLWSQAVKSASHNLVNWGKNTQWAGRQMMVGLTIPFVAFAAGASALAYSVDKELTKIVKVYDFVGTNISGQTERLRKDSMETAKFMARNYAQAAKDTLAITAALAASGQTGSTLQASTRTVGRAMFLGDLNQEDAIKTAITLQTVYAKKTDDAAAKNKALAESFDYLNNLENATALSMQDMTVAVPKLAGVMNSLGGSLQDIGTLMTAAKAGGIDAAEGANALKTIAFRLAAPSGTARKAFAEETGGDLQAIVDRTEGKTIPMLKELATAMKGLDGPAKANLLAKMFGIFQGSKGGIIANQMLDLADATTQVGRAYSVGTAGAEQWARIREQEEQSMRNSASGKFKIALESIKVEMAELGETFLPVATSILGFFSGIAKRFNDLSEGKKRFILFGLAIGAIIGPVVMITGVLATLFATIIRSAATFTMFVSRFKAVNAEQHATELLAKQSTLAFYDQATAARILANSLNGVHIAMAKVAEDNALMIMNTGGRATAPGSGARMGPALPPITSTVGKDGQTRYYTRNEATGKNERMKNSAAMANINSRAMENSAEKTAAATGKVANSADKASKSFKGANANIAMAAGSMGLLLGGTNAWVQGISMALFTLPMLTPVLSRMAAAAGFTKMTAGIKAAATAASTKLGPVVSRLGKGLLALGPALGPFGVALAVAAGAGLILYKNMKKVERQMENVNKAGDTMTEVLGGSVKSSSEWTDSRGKQRSNVALAAEEFEKQNKDAVNKLKSLTKSGDDYGLRDRVIKIGLDVYANTGDAQKAKDAVQAALIAAGNPTMNIDLKLENEGWVRQQRERMNRDLIQEAINNRPTGKDPGDWDWHAPRLPDFGRDNEVKANLKAQAKDLQKIWTDFSGGDIDANEAKKRFQEITNTWISSGEKMVKDVRANFTQHDTENFAKYGINLSIASDKDIAYAIMTNKELQDSLNDSSDSAFAGHQEILGLADGYREVGKETAKLTGTENVRGRNTQNLATIQDILFGNMQEGTIVTKSYADAAGGAAGSVDGLADSFEKLTDAQKEAGEVQKTAMGTVWQGVLDHAADQLDTRHDAAIDQIQAGGDARTKAIEDEAKAQDKVYDQQAKDMDKRQSDEQKRLDKNLDKHHKDVEKVYDDRIKKIQDVTDAETKADDQRQKMFEAEKARIQRLADMYNQNIDVNMALNSGNMDEAAKLTNNMRASQEQWALDDAAATSGDALAQGNEKRQGQIDEITKAKDARMATLADEEQAAKDRLKERQDAEKEALDAEKQAYQDSIDARKAAEEKKTQAAIDGSNKRYEAEKASLDLALARLKVMTPKNAAELQHYTDVIAGIYADHGMKLDTTSAEWADYVARSMRSAADVAKETLADDAKWKQIAAGIGDDIAQGMLGMTFDEFLTWMQTGKMPTPKVTKTGATAGSAANFRQAEQASQAAPKPPDRYSNKPRPDVQHSGGPVGGGTTGRAGRPLNASLYSDEYPIIAQKGEFMIQRKAVDKVGLDTLHAINNGNFHHSGGIMGAVGAMASGALRKGVQKAMTLGIARVSGNPTTTGATPPLDPNGMPPVVGGWGVGKDIISMGTAGLSWTQSALAGNRFVRLINALISMGYTPRSIGGYNPRTIAGSSTWSNHAYGAAIDIDPSRNPRYGSSSGGPYALPAGMSQLARSLGLNWGGDYNTSKDYMHFEVIGAPSTPKIPGMNIGGTIKYDNTIANLHKNEKVLTAPLSATLERGINNLDGAGNVTYDISMDFRGAVIRENVDIEKAVVKVLNEKESKLGRKRVIK